MKYPKLTAAIDDMLAALVKDHGEDVIAFMMEYAMKDPMPWPPPEKPVAVPVTKEIVPVTTEFVISEQSEVRNGY